MRQVAQWLAVVFIVITALAIAICASIPRPGSRTRAYLGIINTLRQIDAAKRQYATEHQTRPETVLSREQVLQYFPERFWNLHAVYKIKAVDELPEAVLPTAFDSLPANTVVRLQTNNSGYEIIPPPTRKSGSRN